MTLGIMIKNAKSTKAGKASASGQTRRPLQPLTGNKLTAANNTQLPPELAQYSYILITGRCRTHFNKEDMEQTLIRANKIVNSFPKSSEDCLLLVTGAGDISDNKKFTKTMERIKKEKDNNTRKMTEVMTAEKFHKLWNVNSGKGKRKSHNNDSIENLQPASKPRAH